MIEHIRKTGRRLLIFIVAYNAQRTILDVIARIPAGLSELLDVEVLLIDDCSQDDTVVRCRELTRHGGPSFKLHVLSNPVNQGYGGNQKIGYHFAIRHGFDYVALLHGDGQYAPECLPELVTPLLQDEADAVFGSRMLTPGAALRGGMPLYKFIGNRILTSIQNTLLRSQLSEFHSGYRIYSTNALRSIPFSLNSQGFPFDTEIIIQLMTAGKRIRELAIPTYYGSEISHVNGIPYAWDVVRKTLIARSQELGLFYDRRFDCAPRGGSGAAPRDAFPEPNSAAEFALKAIPAGARVLNLGGKVAAAFRTINAGLAPEQLNDRHFRPDLEGCDHVLMLDVVEDLLDPELVFDRLFDPTRYVPGLTIIVSAGNAAFFITRLMLLMGQFNYGKRGILDMKHRRLFTIRSLSRLLNQAGFDITDRRGFPAPFARALGNTRSARLLHTLNRIAIRLAPGLFSFEVVVVAKSRPSLEYLLAAAYPDPRRLQAGKNEA